ncbi:hypothetical protein [Cribrihabitans pelagius]|uniref:hypothetical protein n=1 Tax=Cribrihabitans pelagius TaxID=1765746 RepID=UPI003B5BF29A
MQPDDRHAQNGNDRLEPCFLFSSARDKPARPPRFVGSPPRGRDLAGAWRWIEKVHGIGRDKLPAAPLRIAAGRADDARFFSFA